MCNVVVSKSYILSYILGCMENGQRFTVSSKKLKTQTLVSRQVAQQLHVHHTGSSGIHMLVIYTPLNPTFI